VRNFRLSNRFQTSTSNNSEQISHHEGPNIFMNPIKWLMFNKSKLKSYGTLAVVTYFSVYLITLSGLFILVNFKMIKGPDVNKFLNEWSVKKFFIEKEVHIEPKYQDFATAWVLTKLTEPVRLGVTVAMLPFLVKKLPASILQAFGVTTKPAGIKALYQHSKEMAHEAREHLNHRKKHV
jgi:Protein of unknown function (DUF1279)